MKLLNAQTVHGWLSLLAAITSWDRPGSDAATLVSACPLPVGVVDLSALTVLAMSRPMATLLNLTDPVPQPVDLTAVSDRSDELRTLFELLRTGTINMYAASRSLRRRGMGPLVAENWLVAVDLDGQRRALWLMMPLDEAPGARLSEPQSQEWPHEAPGLVVGSFTADLQLGRVSVDAQAVIGYPGTQLVGTALSDLVHPDDLSELFKAMGACLVDRAGVAVQLRLGHRQGQWITTNWIVTPVVSDQLRFGFAFTTSRADRVGDDGGQKQRLAALEGHLWRISQEIQASGIATGLAAVGGLPKASGPGNLSPRQWEVLTRLLRGERVPTIAKGLYVSQSTVRNHLSDMFKKLGVGSQEELVALFRTDTGEDPAGL